MQYVCPHDGCRHAFVSEGNRTQHLNTKHRFATRAKASRPLKPFNAAFVSQYQHDNSPGVNSTWDPSQNDGTSESDDRILTELDALSLGTFLCSDEFDDLYDAALHAEGEADSPQKFNSNIELLLFLARSGLSASLQQDLLDMLHHKEFDPKQVRQCCYLFLTLRHSLTCMMMISDG